MGSHQKCSLESIYREPYDFSLSFHNDMEAFLNLKEFAALHIIDGDRVPCVITGDKSRHAQQEGVYSRNIILWISNEYVDEPYAGLSVNLDGRMYIIQDARLVQGEIWRIELGISDG